MSFIKKVFSTFLPKRGYEKPDSNKMVLCFHPDKIYPYQIDFGARYLCNKLKLETPTVQAIDSAECYVGFDSAEEIENFYV